MYLRHVSEKREV